jgi:hypothetical protein
LGFESAARFTHYVVPGPPKTQDPKRKTYLTGSQKKTNQLDQRGNTFWGPIELVERTYSAVDSSSTDFFAILEQ